MTEQYKVLLTNQITNIKYFFYAMVSFNVKNDYTYDINNQPISVINQLQINLSIPYNKIIKIPILNINKLYLLQIINYHYIPPSITLINQKINNNIFKNPNISMNNIIFYTCLLQNIYYENILDLQLKVLDIKNNNAAIQQIK